MLIVISPAKTLNFEKTEMVAKFSTNDFLAEAEKLVSILRKYSAKQLAELMVISPNLAHLNQDRYVRWNTPFTAQNAKPALFAFQGDVYTGMDAESFSQEDVLFAQDHLRILSGLYGVLRPLDLMQAYRLEMGTKLVNPKFKDLYSFWGNKLSKKINEAVAAQGDQVLINLASNEYFKSLNTKEISADIITPVFKDFSHGEYKIISFYAKKARGLMSRFILQNKLKTPEELKHFDTEGYYFSEAQSSSNQFVFLRG
jgi:cytoplasmic iron level regulating protein YaaA (DUF328/UPF0246 family)